MKYQMRKFITATSIFLLCGYANASTWHWIGESTEGRTFVEKDGIVIDGHMRKAWISEVLHKEKFLPTDPPKAYLSTNSLMVFDCRDRSITWLEKIFYSREYRTGEVVASIKNRPENIPKFSGVPPDSVSEQWLNFVCSSPESRNP